MHPGLDPTLLDELCVAGRAVWDRFREHRGEGFHALVPADYVLAHEALRQLVGRGDSFVELGSGVGVITILADLLGFEATGVEIDPWLVEHAEELAQEFGSSASFAQGSFVPAEFQARVDSYGDDFLTIAEGQPAWRELGLELADFDVIYTYPWPDAEELHHELVRCCGRPGALALLFDGTEGYRLFSDGREEPLAIQAAEASQ